MTLAEDIISNHSTLDSVNAGDIVTVDVDHLYLQDGNSPTIKRLFQQYGLKKVFNPDKISVFFDHSVLSPSIDISNRLKEAEEFASQHQLNIYNKGEGISHLVALEKGIYSPKSLVVATDSHTCTGGVVQSLSLGMGATDIAAAMVTGKTWVKVPMTCWVRLTGKPLSVTSAKDIMIYILGKFDPKAFVYKSIEWCGDYFSHLSQGEMVPFANMAVELGAKCAFVPPYQGSPEGMSEIEVTDSTDKMVIDLNIDGLPPYISAPHLPYNANPIHSLKNQVIDYVFIGSCANSNLTDIQVAVDLLSGRMVHKKVRLIVTPGSKKIYQQAMKNGLLTTLLDSGAIITPPGCGTCVGTQGYIPADGDRVFSTMNRNFLGRMGNGKAKIWLGSPRVAAAVAVLGYIPSLKELQLLCDEKG